MLSSCHKETPIAQPIPPPDLIEAPTHRATNTPKIIKDLDHVDKKLQEIGRDIESR
jgi:hypothetical protein